MMMHIIGDLILHMGLWPEPIHFTSLQQTRIACLVFKLRCARPSSLCVYAVLFPKETKSRSTLIPPTQNLCRYGFDIALDFETWHLKWH